MDGVSSKEYAIMKTNFPADALTDLFVVNVGIQPQSQKSKSKGKLTVYIVDQSM